MNIIPILILLLMVCKSSQFLFPHIVWLYWDSGEETLSKFSKACLERLRSLHQDTDWEIRFVDYSSLKIWLDKSQFEELEEINHGNVQLSIQSKVDFYRLFFLRKYGGVWIDVTIFLHQNLNWLDHLKQNPYVLNKEFSDQPQFFYFYINRESFGKFNIKYDQYNIFTKLDGENSFLAAPKQSRFVKDLIIQFKKLVKFGRTNYMYSEEDLNLPFQYRPYWMAYLATAIIQYQKDKSFRLIINEDKQIPKANFYRIWGISRGIGLYHQSQSSNVKKLFEGEGRRGDRAKYCTKIHHFGPQQMMNNILSGNELLIQQQSQNYDSHIYNQGKTFFSYNLRCLYQIRIDQDSVINKYLLSKIDIKKYFDGAVIKKDIQTPLICKYTNFRQLKGILQIINTWAMNSFWIFLVIQCLVQYFYLFEISNKIEIKFHLNKHEFKKKVFKKAFVLIFSQGQLTLIHSQYILFMQGSPTAIFVGLAISIIVLMVFSNLMLETPKQLQGSKVNFYCLISTILVFEYYLEYEMTVWNYKGVIYNYETLTLINSQKLILCQLQIIKLFVLMIVVFIFQNLKVLLKAQLQQHSLDQKENYFEGIEQIEDYNDRVKQLCL